MGGPTRTSADASVPRLAGFSLITEEDASSSSLLITTYLLTTYPDHYLGGAG
jgi:hypothetical protein